MGFGLGNEGSGVVFCDGISIILKNALRSAVIETYPVEPV